MASRNPGLETVCSFQIFGDVRTVLKRCGSYPSTLYALLDTTEGDRTTKAGVHCARRMRSPNKRRLKHHMSVCCVTARGQPCTRGPRFPSTADSRVPEYTGIVALSYNQPCGIEQGSSGSNRHTPRNLVRHPNRVRRCNNEDSHSAQTD